MHPDFAQSIIDAQEQSHRQALIALRCKNNKQGHRKSIAMASSTNILISGVNRGMYVWFGGEMEP